MGLMLFSGGEGFPSITEAASQVWIIDPVSEGIRCFQAVDLSCRSKGSKGGPLSLGLLGARFDNLQDRALNFVHHPSAPPRCVGIKKGSESMMASWVKSDRAFGESLNLVNAVQHIVEPSPDDDVPVECGVRDETGIGVQGEGLSERDAENE